MFGGRLRRRHDRHLPRPAERVRVLRQPARHPGRPAPVDATKRTRATTRCGNPAGSSPTSAGRRRSRFRSAAFASPTKTSQSWGIHVFRNRPRESREQMSWAPISRDENCFFCQAGTMSGITGVNQGRNLEMLPYVLASQAGGLERRRRRVASTGTTTTPPARPASDSSTASRPTTRSTSPTTRISVRSNPTRPRSTPTSTFALFYPEKRPFFLEGADMFMSPDRRRCTRARSTIPDPGR